MQAMAVTGTGIEAAGAAVAARGKEAPKGAKGEANDFGIALRARLQAVSIAVENAAHLPRRATALPTGSSTKEAQDGSESSAEKPSRKESEGLAGTAVLEVDSPSILSPPPPPEPIETLRQTNALSRTNALEQKDALQPQNAVRQTSALKKTSAPNKTNALNNTNASNQTNALKQTLESADLDSAEGPISTGQVLLADRQKGEPPSRWQGISLGISSPEAGEGPMTPHPVAANLTATKTAATKRDSTNLVTAKKEPTSVAATALGSNPGAPAAAGPASAAGQSGATLATPFPAAQQDGTPIPSPAAKKSDLAPPQFSAPEGPGSRTGMGPERGSAAASPGGELPLANSPELSAKAASTSLVGATEDLPTEVAASARSGQPAAAPATLSLRQTGKTAGKSAAPGGAVGGGSMPGAAEALAGANGLAAEAGPVAWAGDPGSGRARGATANSPGESFQHIDTAAEPPRLLRTTANLVEVGVNDPAHGWVEVRAENTSGQVHASLSASSVEALSALHAHLPEIAGYLADREIGVRSLAVDRGDGENRAFAETGGGLGGQGREFSGGSNPNADGGAGRHSPPSLPGGVDTANHFQSDSSNFSASEAAIRLAGGRGAVTGYSPHTINVLA